MQIIQIKIIRQLRIGTSYLVGHSPFVYNTPEKCPCCSETVTEDTRHYIYECGRFSTERKKFMDVINPILKNSKWKNNLKTILGFPDKINDIRKEEYIITREILWSELSRYISSTCRFSKPKWIIPFLKSGIG